MITSFIRRITIAVLWASGVIGANCFKLSFIIGSHAAFFSASQFLIPVAGYYGGLSTSILLMLGPACIKALISGSLPYGLAVYHIPSFCGALYYRIYRTQAGKGQLYGKKLIGCMVPLVCMILFSGHSVGSQAWVYSMYWIIPIVTTCLPHTSHFLQALGSTFTAHAIGSVIAVYSGTLTPSQWIGLIPIVAIERIVFAMGIVACSSVVEKLYSAPVRLSQVMHQAVHQAVRQ